MEDYPMIELRAAHHYGRIPPSIFGLWSARSDILRWFYQKISETHANCPAEGCMRLANVFLINGQQAIGSDDNWIPDTVLDYAAAEQVLPVMRHIRKDAPPPSRSFDDIHTALIYKSGSANYGHFLTDMAPKVANIAKAGHSRVRFLVPDDGKWSCQILKAICDIFGIQSTFVIAKEIDTIDGAYFYTPVSRHNDGKRKSYALLEMRARIRDSIVQITMRNRRLYVSRSRNFSRGVTNNTEIEELFLHHGFDVVYPERMSFEEQVRVFSEATHVAGPLGAGMANMVFCEPGTEIFLLDPGLGDCYFWDIACLVGLRFHWIFSRELDSYTLERATAPFFVDVHLVRAALRFVGL